jgi:predicted outer membrane protein
LLRILLVAAALASQAPPSEVFSRLHHGHRALMDAGQWVRQRGESNEVKAFATRVLHDHDGRDRALLSFAKSRHIDVGVAAPGSADSVQAERDIGRNTHRLAAMNGAELDEEFAKAVIDLDRDLIKVAEEGARAAPTAGIRNELDNTTTFLRGEIGEAERIQRAAGHERR